jgi:outer membrane protein insertion porin family
MKFSSLLFNIVGNRADGRARAERRRSIAIHRKPESRRSCRTGRHLFAAGAASNLPGQLSKTGGMLAKAPECKKLSLRLLRHVQISLLVVGIAAAAPAGPQSSPAAAETAILIAVEGNRRLEAETIRSYFHPGAGGGLDAVSIDQGLKALYATGLFEDVRIRQAGGRLVVSIVEAPVINRMAFEGNRRVKDDQLTSEVQSKPRSTLSRPVVQADLQRIVEIYRRNGRYDVRVEPKIIEMPNNRVDLVFEIAEGEKTTVMEIRFIGNHSFGAARLKAVIRTHEASILSFIKNSDIYHPDRIEADRDLLRRFYLTKGFADVQIVSAAAEFDPQKKGFIITFAIDEGERYRFGTVDVISNVRDVEPNSLRTVLKAGPGAVYNAEAMEKTTEQMTVEMSKRGYGFAQVHPRGDRDPVAHRINVVFVVDEGPRTYIERINIRGNTRTRDEVIRREFDIAEGDAYSKVLIDRAERRLKNLNYFKTVRITSEPGSAPDRIVIDVELEDQLTGEFSVAGGFSTVQGFLGEVSIGERNLLGQGQYAKASLSYGQYARGVQLSYAEPYFLGNRVLAGVDLYANQLLESPYQSYGSTTYGLGTRLSTPLTENVTAQWRYAIYNQSLSLNPALMDCSRQNAPPLCYANGEASLPVKQAVRDGPVWVSAVGTTLEYNTLENRNNPSNGVYADLKQDLAGLGGNVNFLRTTSEIRYFHEISSEIVGLTRLQAGYITPWGGKPLPLLNSFFGGPQLVRGFAPAGFGPRDLTAGTTMDNVGASRYWAGTAELQSRMPGLSADFGLKLAIFADVGSVWGYPGRTMFAGQSLQVADSNLIRSSVGAGLIWDSPMGPLRADYGVATSKTHYDILQPFRFGVGPF